MKKVVKYGLPGVLLLVGGLAYMLAAEDNAGDLRATDKNFLLEAAHTRMMDWAQGNLAIEKTQSRKYQQYGKRLMKDQNRLMEELKKIAGMKELVLPSELSGEKTEELERLRSISGESFERRFRRMIIKDHKRDIAAFQKATESPDPEIREFAIRHLPLLEQHLEMARDLNK